jgi:hypothetical protein
MALAVFILSAGVGWALPVAAALARPASVAAPRADASGSTHEGAAARRAPGGPPLTSGLAAQGGGEAGEAMGPSPQAQEDPLVSNGLGSPFCRGIVGGASTALPAFGRRNCETSGFVAAPAPTASYGIDVHIDTGVLGLSSGGLLTAIQDLFISPVWTGLVWTVHAVVVMLEWSFTIDLLDTATADGVGRGLREMQALLTMPWLAIVLAIAAILALYNGLVRRRVAETIGRAFVMSTMMAGGMWVIADPTGTVGALGQWANQASLGTLAVAARGTPSEAGGVLARSMDTVFAAAIEVPWCYLEFGDVAWCRDPARLDQRLRAAGLRIAAAELSATGCAPGTHQFSPCPATGRSQVRALEHSAELLRAARSNGAIFLALPANGPARNSINEQGSLLRTMCESSEATNCHGAMAAQAEFRTNGGTWARAGGLLLVAAGVLGMMLLFGFIAVRLLVAAIFSLLYLLLAPGMVLAPALGETGRSVFRRWVAHLLGAVVSKLLFSFLLGVVLAVLEILSGLSALGWWTQWLLMSAFWWSAYLRRHQALGAAEGAVARDYAGTSETLARRMRTALETPRTGLAAVQSAKKRADERIARFGASAGQRDRSSLVARSGRALGREHLAGLRHGRANVDVDQQAVRMSKFERRDDEARRQAAPALRERLAARRSQLQRVERERLVALQGGNTRRAAGLHHRARRIEREIERLSVAGPSAGEGGGTPRRIDTARTREQERFLDSQAALPRADDARRYPGERRDYAALAALAGYGREEYARLAPAGQRAARVEIDRQLAWRSERKAVAGPGASSAAPYGAARHVKPKGGTGASAAGRARAARDPHQTTGPVEVARAGRGPSERTGATESAVMRDAREVAAGRKRQLGIDRN